MRKKLLTVALAAVMFLGSTVYTLAVDSVNTSSPDLNNSASTEDATVDASTSISDVTADKIEDSAVITGMKDITLDVSAPSKADVVLVTEAGKTVLADKKY